MLEIKSKKRAVSVIDFSCSTPEKEVKIKKDILKFNKKLKKKYDLITDSDVSTTTRRGDRKLDLTRMKIRWEK